MQPWLATAEDISGAKAPASLKRRSWPGNGHGKSHISGAKAPASLKRPRTGQDIDHAGRDISGAKAPASLKLEGVPVLDLRHDLYLRGKSPGLIEASTCAARRTCCTKYLRGKSPGLIEAARRWWLSSSKSSNISGAKAPASLKPQWPLGFASPMVVISPGQKPRPH